MLFISVDKSSKYTANKYGPNAPPYPTTCNPQALRTVSLALTFRIGWIYFATVFMVFLKPNSLLLSCFLRNVVQIHFTQWKA